MAFASGSTSLVKTVRLDETRLTELLDRLDENDGGPGGKGEETFRYRTNLVVHLQQAGGTTSIPYMVPTRGISVGNISFLHGGYIHANTKCLIQLTTPHGTWHDTGAVITNCQYIQGNIHLVGAKFDAPIDPALYCSAAVHARILLVDDDESITRLVKFNLIKLNAEVDIANDGKQAVDMALKGVYDLIIMDMEMPVMNGFEAAKELRARGYSGVIVAATALTQPADQESCLQAGCDRYIPKPYTREHLTSLLASLREEPLYSTFCDDQSMSELITSFVGELPGRIRALEEAMATKDLQNLLAGTRKLKAEGTGYGFDPISEAAVELERFILARKAITELRTQVDAVVKLCLQARSSVKQGR